VPLPTSEFSVIYKNTTDDTNIEDGSIQDDGFFRIEINKNSVKCLKSKTVIWESDKLIDNTIFKF